MKKLPGLCLDFDGVIHWYRKGWHGVDVITDDPTPGAIESLREYVKHFTVHIYSARSATPEGILAMQDYIENHDRIGGLIDLIKFPTSKPGCMVYMDDRGFRFEGKFPTPEEITALFKTWTGYKSSQ